MQNPEKEWFGEKHVSAAEKTALVTGVFDNVAAKYDLMNDLMSGGMHRLWKDRLVRMIRPRPGLKYLDVAGGTGDIAFRIRKKSGPAAITVFDLNPNMLEVGRNRAIDQGWLNDFDWVTGNAESLPFPDNSFDVYTIAFGLRNVTHIDTALAEAARVLKPGGRFFCMEFSRVEQPILSKLYDGFSFGIIPKLGKAVANDEESYQYLVESIRKFPPQRKLARRMELAGFAGVKYENLSAGVVAIHKGIKP
ncbi:MAG: bifunctional demethylmenaquinone methyltransferase/2-methoxy-6-polyprenyl-1,4-benzoquinol methylase UbiE [Alphaproteobacteria bacterium]